MITYEELIDLALIQTGQYILDVEDLEIDRPKLEMLLIRELAWFSGYHPVKKSGEFLLYNDKEFTEEKDGVIPVNITNIRRLQTSSYPLFTNSMGRYATSLRWRYSKPYLTFMYPSQIYIVDYFAPHKYEDGKIKTLDSHSPFVNLFIAQFMISLGRGRASFVLNDIPITTNADALISEGQELLQSTKEFIQETSSYHFAIRM